MSVFVVATIAIPIALYLHARLIVTPLVLGLVVVVWTVLGTLTGTIVTEAVLGLVLYTFGLAPLCLAVYPVFGGGEYLFRRKIADLTFQAVVQSSAQRMVPDVDP